jgi:hypothetical protein
MSPEDAEWEAAVAAAYGGPDPDPEPDGRLAAIGGAVDRAYAANATRIGEEIVDAIERRPKDEVKIARALRRAEAGTLVEPAYFRAAPPVRDAAGRYSSACGPQDDLGRCAARYHAAGCGAVYDSHAVAGQPAERVEAYRQQLALATPSQPEPGYGAGDAWGDLLDSGVPVLPEADLRARVLHSMGEADAPPPPPRTDLPDVSALRAGLGI